MMEFIDHMAFVCLTGAAIGFAFLILVGILETIDYLSKGKFKDAIVNFFKEESGE